MQNQKSNVSKKLLFLLIPAFCFLLWSVQTYVSGTDAKRASRAFDAFTQDMFVQEISSNTLNLHYTLAHPENYGITDVPVTLGAAESTPLVTGASPTADDYLRELYRIPYHSLSSKKQLTYDILSLTLENEKDNRSFLYYDEPLGATAGIQAQLPILLAEYAFSSQNDIETYLALLAQTDVYFRALLDYERAKSAAGLFMSAENAQAVIDQCRAFLAGGAEENFLSVIFKEKLEALPFLNDSQRQVYLSRNLSVLRHHLLPAYELLADGLEDLKQTGKNPYGLCYFHNGKAYYEYLLRSKTGSWLPVSGIEKRIRTQLAADLEACRALLVENPQIFADASFAGLPTRPEDILADLGQRLADDFPAPARVSCEVKYVHESLEQFLSPAFYLTPPIDDITQNTIYINRAADSSPLDLYTTLAHEGFPGHLYQNTLSYRHLAPVRSLLSFGGYTEGWATYVEMESYRYAAECMEEENAAKTAEFYRLNRSIMLGISSLLDICIHYHGYTRAEAADFLAQLGFTSPKSADAVYDAVLESPVNYLKYYLGYLTFADLRSYCETKYPDHFQLRVFHEKILEIGPCPFPILEKYLTAYFESL